MLNKTIISVIIKKVTDEQNYSKFKNAYLLKAFFKR